MCDAFETRRLESTRLVTRPSSVLIKASMLVTGLYGAQKTVMRQCSSMTRGRLPITETLHILARTVFLGVS